MAETLLLLCWKDEQRREIIGATVVVRKGRGCDRWSNHGGIGEGVAGLREGRERESDKAEGVVGGRRQRGLFIEREYEKKSGEKKRDL